MFEIRHQDEIVGTFSGPEIKQMAREQRLHHEMQIRKSPDGRWQPIASVKGLEVAVATAPVAPGRPLDPPPRPAPAVATAPPLEAPQIQVPMTPRPAPPQPLANRASQDMVVSSQFGAPAVPQEMVPAEDHGEVWEYSQAAPAPTEIDCPFCGEQIKQIAKKCKHCGEILDVTLRAAQQPQMAAAPVVNVMNHNVNTAVATSNNYGPRWSPLVAMLLSFFIPGAGQMYKGQPLNGIVWFFAVPIGYLFFIIPGLLLHVCCVAGAGMGNPYR